MQVTGSLVLGATKENVSAMEQMTATSPGSFVLTKTLAHGLYHYLFYVDEADGVSRWRYVRFPGPRILVSQTFFLFFLFFFPFPATAIH